jgi:hypothetical protein
MAMKIAYHRRVSLACILSVTCGTVLLGGCAGVSFDASLPADLDPSLRYDFDNKDVFRDVRNGSPLETGSVADALSVLAGCWGSFAANIAEGEEPVAIDDYALARFEAGGVLTTWDLEDTGGLFGILFAGHGRYEIVADNRIQFVIDRRDYYNPFSKQYETYVPDPPEVTEYLATLDGKTLYLLMLAQPGDPPPDAGSPDYTMVYRQFACAD